jgi:hypothetical protein
MGRSEYADGDVTADDTEATEPPAKKNSANKAQMAPATRRADATGPFVVFVRFRAG